MSPLRVAIVVLVAAALAHSGGERPALAQTTPVERIPTATLIPAPTIAFPSPSDSNSPALWELVAGRPRLFAMTSIDGWPTRHQGAQLSTLFSAGPIAFENPPPHGVWFEALVPDVDGVWYGYYHNEVPAEVCDDQTRTIPRIGAARSRDFGATWEDLGLVLEAPPGAYDCDSTNRYFVGGVGDFSVALDHEQQYVYFFFSQYVDRERTQGVSVERLTWANRDNPVGKMSVWWRGNTWIPARPVRGDAGEITYIYSGGMPIYRVVDGWHDDLVVDAFWGPSVHWNTYLEQYVMLLNHATNPQWQQEGIYVAFSKSLSNPAAWSTPQRLFAGGQWYPQVMGTEVGTGTDKVAGERARFFMAGRSQYFIQFSR